MILDIKDGDLKPIWDKVQNGRRLSFEDGLILSSTSDLISLGKMAQFVQYEKSGDAVYFSVNQKIEHTNVCVLSCRFCEFAVRKGEFGSYELTNESILAVLTPDITEVHITGGMSPDWPWERYLEMISSIHRRFPTADIKAFTAVEIDFFHKKFKIPIREVLTQLKESGVRTMPGGGAEIFSERVRRLLFNQKIGAKRWFDVHKTAHSLGIPTNSTMLYGHIETPEERLSHMIQLREAQDETGGFLTFIPLAFQPGSTGIRPRNHFTSAIDDLRTIAISRLILDNFLHVKAYWVMLTEEVATVALKFGADDIDGTVGQERIAHDAGAASPMKLEKDRIIKIIRDAGKIPVERDVFYNPNRIYSDNVVGKIPYLNSVPFYRDFREGPFKILPLSPRRMGMLGAGHQINAGLFSLVDYFEQEDEFELLHWCISARHEVQSVLLFSRHGWANLNGRQIGLTEDSSTSVRLLQLLLEKRYGVESRFVRMHTGVNEYAQHDAVLLIGDEALRRKKSGIEGFGQVFDLAAEWYHWMKTPFVFAVWGIRRDSSVEMKDELNRMIEQSLNKSRNNLSSFVLGNARRMGLNRPSLQEYLKGFCYRLGREELESINEFRHLIGELNSVTSD